MWAAIVAMTILLSTNADWSTQRLQRLDLSGDHPSHGRIRGTIPDAVGYCSEMLELELAWQDLRGPIPHVVGSIAKLRDFSVKSNRLLGPLPHAIGAWTTLRKFDVFLNSICGPIPDAVGFMRSLIEFSVGFNSLRGPIPHAVGSMTAMGRFSVIHNSLRGPIPHAVGSMQEVSMFSAFDNSLCGTIPHAVSSMLTVVAFYAGGNCLCGPIPNAVGSMTKMANFKVAHNSLRGAIPPAVGVVMSPSFRLDLSHNSFRGSIPHAVGSMIAMTDFQVSHNSLRGPIPYAVGSMTLLKSNLDVSHNNLHSSIPHAVGSLTKLQYVHASGNSLRGPIPHAVGSMTALKAFKASANSLCGPIPHAVGSMIAVRFFQAAYNSLRGSIPHAVGSMNDWNFEVVCLQGNRLTGTLPVFKDVQVLMVSGNLLEGGLSSTFRSQLVVFDLSGSPGRIGGLTGPLPPTLRQASELRILTVANQQLDGGIPTLASTLSLLALHGNRLKVLPDIHLEDNASKTTILLHENLLSCYVPVCGNATVKTSVIAIANRLRYPKDEFPPWVHKHEHDPLLWVSDTEGISLVRQISGAVGLFLVVVAWKIGSAQLWRSLSRWQIGPATHLWVVEASSRLYGRMAMDASLAVVFISFLLSWDLYACPPTLAILSACLRNSVLTRIFVFLCWCTVSFHSMALEHLTMKVENHKKNQWTTNMLTRRLLLWLLWCVLTMILSTFAILYHVAKSIPGSLQAGKIMSLALKACVGATQGFVSSFLVPYLASQTTLQKHALTTVSNLLMSCLIPTLVIVYLDTGCLGRWVTLWKSCRSDRQLFQHHFVCTPKNTEDCHRKGHGFTLSVPL